MQIKEFHEYITPDGKVYDLHTASSRWVMQSTGWGLPPVEYVTQRGAFQHGETVKDYFLQPRVIQLLINQKFKDRESFWQGRKGLLDAIRPNRQLTETGANPGTLRRILPDGSKRDLKVFVTEGPSFDPNPNGWRERSFNEVIRFIAHDPVIYDPNGVREELSIGSLGLLQFYANNVYSYVDCGALHNAAPKLWISFKFRLDNEWKAAEDYIYIGGSETRRIWKLLRSDLTQVAQGDLHEIIYSIDTDADYVYYGGGNDANRVYKVRKSDLFEVAYSASYLGTIRSIIVSGSYVYISGGHLDTTTVRKLNISDLSFVKDSPAVGTPVSSLAHDSTYIYAGGMGTVPKVFKYRKSDMAYIGESPSYGGQIESIAVDDQYVYACGWTTQKVYKYLKSDLSKVGESADLGGSLMCIVEDGDYIYVGGQGYAAYVFKLRKSDLSQVEVSNYLANIYSIQCSADYIYCSGDTGAKKLYKLRKSDLSQVAVSGSYGGAIWAISKPQSWAPADNYLISKKLDDNNLLFVRLSKDTAQLQFGLISGGDVKFLLNTPQYGWDADTWYHVLASISDTGARLIVDNGTALTDADTTPAPNGNIIIGNLGSEGIKGVIRNVAIGTDTLTSEEETDLYNDIVPADVANHWKLDEGTGTIAEDSAGEDDGTIGSANTWIKEFATDTVEIHYQGTWLTHPTVKVHGPLRDFTIENLDTGEKLAFNYYLLSGRVLTINLGYGFKTVTDDLGRNLIGVLSSDSDLATFHIAPDPEVPNGINHIRLSGTDGMSGETKVEIEYFTKYFGI